VHALTKGELLRLLKAARAASERDWLMILVAYWHGLRASEVVAIVRDDIVDTHLDVQRLKGSNRTVQPLVDHLEPLLNERPALLAFCRDLGGKQRVFPVGRQHFWRIVQRHAASAGLPAHQRHPHILKHSIAAQTIHSAGIENVRQYLGHKSIGSTGAYLKVNDADAATAIRKASEL
jgi:integrase